MVGTTYGGDDAQAETSCRQILLEAATVDNKRLFHERSDEALVDLIEQVDDGEPCHVHRLLIFESQIVHLALKFPSFPRTMQHDLPESLSTQKSAMEAHSGREAAGDRVLGIRIKPKERWVGWVGGRGELAHGIDFPLEFSKSRIEAEGNGMLFIVVLFKGGVGIGPGLKLPWKDGRPTRMGDE